MALSLLWCCYGGCVAQKVASALFIKELFQKYGSDTYHMETDAARAPLLMGTTG